MINIYKRPDNNFKDTSKLTIRADGRTIDTNFNSNDDRVTIEIDIRIPKNTKFIFEDNVTSITKYNQNERLECFFIKKKHKQFSNISLDRSIKNVPSYNSSLIYTGGLVQFSNSITTRDAALGYIHNITGTSDSSGTTGIRAYGWDFPNKILYFFRNGVQMYAIDLSSYSEIVSGINNMDFAKLSRPTFSNNVFTNTFNFGESGFTYSYPGFTPLCEVPEYTSGCYPHSCFIY